MLFGCLVVGFWLSVVLHYTTDKSASFGCRFSVGLHYITNNRQLHNTWYNVPNVKMKNI